MDLDMYFQITNMLVELNKAQELLAKQTIDYAYSLEIELVKHINSLNTHPILIGFKKLNYMVLLSKIFNQISPNGLIPLDNTLSTINTYHTETIRALTHMLSRITIAQDKQSYKANKPIYKICEQYRALRFKFLDQYHTTIRTIYNILSDSGIITEIVPSRQDIKAIVLEYCKHIDSPELKYQALVYNLLERVNKLI